MNDLERLEQVRAKIASFPKSPGVYLMKDAEGRVLYIGKAKDLRARVSSYFQPAADLLNTRGPDIANMATRVHDVDFVACETEVDALLKEARLIKDIQPPHNAALKDDKTFPYLEITTGDDFPGVYVTRTPRHKGSKLYGPFASAGGVRDAVNALQKVFKFRTCELEILDGDESRRYFRPCLLHAINQCTAPCADLISRDDYRKDVDRLKSFLKSKRSTLIRRMEKDMAQAAAEQRFEEAATLRDRIRAIASLSLSGDVEEHRQVEVFYVDPTEGLDKLADLLGLEDRPRSIEGIDIANLQGGESVGSLVCFIDGRAFKPGYRRFQIKTVTGQDDYAMIREVVMRRYRHAATGDELYPDIILIDGGLGQLHAALAAFSEMDVRPPMVISLAKKEELVYVQARTAPLKMARNNAALRLLQQVRDEAHRFAQHYHHILRRKRTLEEDVREGRRPPNMS
ncbi:MAG TPA: excinuclease ABC subunit UvrC [Phycisphaerae bacterium]|nr:excinuclease ABC subunit UvrC [Phycisphaerae bacterium]